MDVSTKLNEELFKKVVGKAFAYPVECRDFHIEKQVANGSYCSRIFKASISYRPLKSNADDVGDASWQVLNFFVKVLLESLTSYSKEHFMYAEIVPAFDALININTTPKVYWTEKTNTELNVFEDLSLQGYELFDRLVGYNASQAKAVLRKLAKFHAASFLYTEAHPEVVAGITGHFYKDVASLQAFGDAVILANTKYAAPIVAQWPGYADIAKKMLLNTGATFRRKMLQALDKQETKLRILLHGDLWIRNIMMRKVEGDDDWDTIFLDFQNIFEGSPVLDIANLMLTSVQLHVLQNQYDELLSDYQKTLADALRSLGYDEPRIPSLQVLKDDLRSVAYYNYYLLIFPFPQTNLSHDLADDVSFDSFSNEELQERNRKDIFSNPRVLDTYKFVLKQLDELGVLDDDVETDINAGALPTYLNDEFIAQALEKAHLSPVAIKSSSIKLANVSGENYCSNIYRVQVNYELNGKILEKHLLLKDVKKALMALGTSETFMYQHVLPDMEKMIKAAGEPLKFKADCLMIDNQEKELYVFEDLNVLGYKLGDRKLGLNAEHARLLLAKLGKFHAVSQVYLEQNLAKVQTQLKDIYFSADPISTAIYRGGLEYVANLVSKWHNFESIAVKVQANAECFEKRANEKLKVKNAKICVISHADLWLNNILYHYDDHGKPDDVIFVDYQGSSLGSPGYDLNLFLYTSLRFDVLQTKRLELLQHYYDSYRATLLRCGAKQVPSFEDLLAEVDRLAYISFYAALCELPYCAINAEASEGFTSETFGDEETMKLKRPLLYDANERVLETLRYVLPYFDQLGVLD